MHLLGSVIVANCLMVDQVIKIVVETQRELRGLQTFIELDLLEARGSLVHVSHRALYTDLLELFIYFHILERCILNYLNFITAVIVRCFKGKEDIV